MPTYFDGFSAEPGAKRGPNAMLEVLQFYVSGFWVWLGITYGMVVVGGMLLYMIATFRGLK